MKTKVFGLVMLLFAFSQAFAQDPEALREMAKLKQMGYFNLPSDHKVNGATVASWQALDQRLAQQGAIRTGGFSLGRIMTAGPKDGVIPQTIFGALGAIFIHDFVVYNAQLDPITGEPLPKPAHFQQYPDAGETFLFNFDWSLPPVPFSRQEYSAGRSRRYALEATRKADPGLDKFLGIYKNPD